MPPPSYSPKLNLYITLISNTFRNHRNSFIIWSPLKEKKGKENHYSFSSSKVIINLKSDIHDLGHAFMLAVLDEKAIEFFNFSTIFINFLE